MSKTDKTIRVLLADDHPALRAGIRTILERAPDIQVVGEAEGGTDARRLTTNLRPQVLVLDQALPGPLPAETVAWVRAHCPETAVLVANIAYAGGLFRPVPARGAAGVALCRLHRRRRHLRDTGPGRAR